MRTKRNSGFTLVEILIVVVILGILAAIVIPQFSNASSEAKVANCKSNLQTLRSQIALFKIKNGDTPPTCTDAGFADSADDDSNTMVPDYLQSIPVNPLSGTSTMTQGAVDLATFSATAGWYYNTATGIMHAANDATAYAY
ncbi:MAG: prepilin-type N-terminal cleavage/methylation domain-containing protein [Anaerohalosphaera sp.]|nr:prepilin-type N-terminal cleavage/methylation domain-containing protein [Anaerohalosphaera sp.]